MKINATAFIALLTGLLGSGAAIAEDEKAWIAKSQSSGSVTLQAFAVLPPGQSGRYEFVATKSGASGSSVTRQGGAVTGGRTSALTTSKLSLHSAEVLNAELIVTTSTGETHRDVVEITGR